MGDPESWRWVWLIATGGFLIGEMATPGSFFLLPFAAGALVAFLSSFVGAGVVVQWLLFLGVSAAASAAFIPLRNRLDEVEPTDGIGSRRLLNQQAVVLRAIEPGPTGLGMVRVGREEWRAQSADHTGIPEGATVHVVEVLGTAVVVSGTPMPAKGHHS